MKPEAHLNAAAEDQLEGLEAAAAVQARTPSLPIWPRLAAEALAAEEEGAEGIRQFWTRSL